MTKHCVNCGKSFEPVNPAEDFCSDWCRRKHDREEGRYACVLYLQCATRAYSSMWYGCLDAGEVDRAENWIRRRYGSISNLRESMKNLPPKGYQS